MIEPQKPPFVEGELYPTYADVLHADTETARQTQLLSMFGSAVLDVQHELRMGIVDEEAILRDYGPELDSHYFTNYMRSKFGLTRQTREQLRNFHVRMNRHATQIANYFSELLYPNSDLFEVSRDIAVMPDSPSIRAIQFLAGHMPERTAYEYFRHIGWYERSGLINVRTANMRGLSNLDALWHDLSQHLCGTQLGDTHPALIWSVHDEQNAPIYISQDHPGRIEEGHHIKIHPLEFYHSRKELPFPFRFIQSPRAKSDIRSELKVEEDILSGKKGDIEEVLTDSLGVILYVDGEESDRDEVAEIIGEWFGENYPHSDISEKSSTTRTEGKGSPLSWRRFKLKINPRDARHKSNTSLPAELIVATLKDAYTNRYEISSGEEHRNRAQQLTDFIPNGRAHALHELRRTTKLIPAHFPIEIYFPEATTTEDKQKRKMGMARLVNLASQRIVNGLRDANQPDQDMLDLLFQ